MAWLTAMYRVPPTVSGDAGEESRQAVDVEADLAPVVARRHLLLPAPPSCKDPRLADPQQTPTRHAVCETSWKRWDEPGYEI
jgi:hypothetical protein